MKRLLVLLSLSWALPVWAQVAVQNLPSGSAISGANYAICDQSSVTNKCTYTQVAAFSTGYIISQANTWADQQTFSAGIVLGAAIALPNGSTATTQTTGDNTTKVATDAFVLANAGGGSGTVTDGSGTTTPNELLASSTTAHTYSVVTTLPTAAEPAHTGDVTNSAGSLALTIGNGAVTLAKQANFSASSLMGNPTGSAAAPSAITLGAGLTFSGSTLVASGGAATSITPGTTTIVGATSPCLIDNTTSTTMGCATTSSATLADLQAVTTFTIAPTGCTPSAHTGGPFGGTITLASGPCTSIVVTMNGATGFTAPNGYHCTAGDRTAIAAGTWIPGWYESASTTTTATIPIPAAAGSTDVISFTCDWF